MAGYCFYIRNIGNDNLLFWISTVDSKQMLTKYNKKHWHIRKSVVGVKFRPGPKFTNASSFYNT